MNMTDPIADMLTHIRNAQQARHQVVAMPTSKVKVDNISDLVIVGILSSDPIYVLSFSKD